MSTYAVRYTAPLWGKKGNDIVAFPVLGSTVLVRRDGVATPVYADRDKSALSPPLGTGLLPVGVAAGEVGLDIDGNLLFWVEPGAGIDYVVTVGGVPAAVPVPTLSGDFAESGIDTSAVILKALVDAKGDLIVAIAADTVARLPVGANDFVLTADSTQAAGLKWAATSGGGAVAPLTLTAPAAANVPLTLKGAASQTGDLLKLQNSASTDLLRINPAGRQLVGDSTMLGVGAGVIDAMLVVNQPNPAIQTQIWRGSPRGDGFAYTARISDGAHFTTNGANTSNGTASLLPQAVRETQTPVSQYMFACHVDLSPAINNAGYVCDTVNGIAHFNGFVQGGGLYPYFRIAFDGELQWGDGATSNPASFTSLRREADGSMAFRPNGTEQVRIKSTGELGVGTAFPVNKLTVDSGGAQIRIRSVPNRYRGDFDMSASGMTFTAYDDTGAVFMPYIVQSSQTQWRLGFTEKMRLSTNGDLGVGTNNPQAGIHVQTRSQFWPAIRAQGAASQSDPIQVWQDSANASLHSITAAGLPRWDAAGNQQTTVGAAGGASALPATPTKYLKVVDSAGTTLVIPAYAAS